jgi:hypothetical protein
MRKERIVADQSVSGIAVQFKLWREAFRVHPDCLKLPPALPGEVAALASDIARQGVLMPVQFRIPEDKTTDDAELLDGRNRLEALQQNGNRFAWVNGKGPHMRDPDGAVTGIPFEFKTAGEVPFPLEHIVSLNVVRRHWTTAQKRQVIAELLKDMPDYSNRQIAQLVGVDGKTVGTVRAHLEALGELLSLDATQGRDGKWRTTSPRRATPPADRDPRTPMERLKEELIATKATIAKYERLDDGPLVTRNAAAGEMARVIFEWMTPSKRNAFWQAFGQQLKPVAHAVDATDSPTSAKAMSSAGGAAGKSATKKPPASVSNMPEEQKAAIREARNSGRSLREIATEHGLFLDQVKTICKTEAPEGSQK